MPETSVDRPNVLVVLTDQWRHDCAGFAGNAAVQTPHCDRLAAGGETFTHAFCAYPVCTPSRYSLLNGLHARQHLGLSNFSKPRDDVPTWPNLLRAAGYRTSAIGKMHYTPTYLDVGFDHMQLAEQHGDGRFDDEYHRDLEEAGLLDVEDLVDQRDEYRELATPDYWETFGAKATSLPDGWHTTDWIGDRAVAEIEGWQGGNPAALVASFVKPHHPFDPPQAWLDQYDADTLPLPAGWSEEPDPRDIEIYPGYFPYTDLPEPALRRVVAHYYATISHLDHQVGRMLDALEAKGLADDTLVVLTADHGEYLGHRHLLLKSNTMYDSVVRVPLVIRWPGGRRAGGRREEMCSLLDVPGTILRAAGFELPATMTGNIDLGEAGAGRELVITENHRGVMARTATHKLIWSPDPLGRRLYDMAADPLEEHDLWDDPAATDVREALTTVVLNWACVESVGPAMVEPRAEGDAAAVAERGRRMVQTAERFAAEQTG